MQNLTTNNFIFPVEEQEVLYGSSLTKDYKAIVRTDTNELISIMPKTYQLLNTKDLIDDLLSNLEKTDIKYTIDNRNYIITNERIRMHLTFPDYKITDLESDINMSLYLDNSYNGSVAAGIVTGAIRAICSNGMVWGKMVNRYSHRHTKGLMFEHIDTYMNKYIDKLPVISSRVKELESLPATSLIKGKAWSNYSEDFFGKKIGEKVSEHIHHDISHWDVYNLYTSTIQHKITNSLMRPKLQEKVANLFEL